MYKIFKQLKFWKIYCTNDFVLTHSERDFACHSINVCFVLVPYHLRALGFKKRIINFDLSISDGRFLEIIVISLHYVASDSMLLCQQCKKNQFERTCAYQWSWSWCFVCWSVIVFVNDWPGVCQKSFQSSKIQICQIIAIK